MLHLLLYNLRVALGDMFRKRFRTFLVLQGMIWGAAAAIMPPAIIDGSRKAMLDRAERVGTDRVVMTADRIGDSGALILDDVSFLEKRFGDRLTAVAPFRTREALIRCGEEIVPGWVVGTTAASVKARGLELRTGAFFTADRPGAVLEPGIAEALTGDPGGLPSGALEVFVIPDSDPEELVRLLDDLEAGDREPDLRLTELLGVLASLPPERREVNDFGMKRNHFLSDMARDLMSNLGVESQMEPWRRDEKTVHVPIEWIEEEGDRIDMIIFRARPEAVVDLIEEVQHALSERNRQPLIRWNLLAPVILKGGLDRYTRLRYATFMLCLVMGAIVISNVMLFYVLESYREIAIRRVEGATKADIALQYLSYSTLLSVTGGLLGLPIGMFIAQIRIWISPAAGLSLIFPWGSAALVVGCTVVSGILAGVLPALRAARLDPVEALRHE
ncbi:MAG: ABC transporter permease [Planctomycetota bacterium]